MAVPNIFPAIVRLIPAIIRFFPATRTLPIPRGIAIPLMNVEPLGDELLDRALAERPQLKVKKRPEYRDESHVLKVSDAIKVVEEMLKDKKLAKLGPLRAAKLLQFNITNEGGIDFSSNPMLDALAEKFRDRSLKQTAPRSRITYRYSKRAL